MKLEDLIRTMLENDHVAWLSLADQLRNNGAPDVVVAAIVAIAEARRGAAEAILIAMPKVFPAETVPRENLQ